MSSRVSAFIPVLRPGESHSFPVPFFTPFSATPCIRGTLPGAWPVGSRRRGPGCVSRIEPWQSARQFDDGTMILIALASRGAQTQCFDLAPALPLLASAPDAAEAQGLRDGTPCAVVSAFAPELEMLLPREAGGFWATAPFFERPCGNSGMMFRARRRCCVPGPPRPRPASGGRGVASGGGGGRDPDEDIP